MSDGNCASPVSASPSSADSASAEDCSCSGAIDTWRDDRRGGGGESGVGPCVVSGTLTSNERSEPGGVGGDRLRKFGSFCDVVIGSPMGMACTAVSMMGEGGDEGRNDVWYASGEPGVESGTLVVGGELMRRKRRVREEWREAVVGELGVAGSWGVGGSGPLGGGKAGCTRVGEAGMEQRGVEALLPLLELRRWKERVRSSSGRGGKLVVGGIEGGLAECLLLRSNRDSRKDSLEGGADCGSSVAGGDVPSELPSPGVGGRAELGAGRCGGGIDVRCDERGLCPNFCMPPETAEARGAGTGDVLDVLKLCIDETDALFAENCRLCKSSTWL